MKLPLSWLSDFVRADLPPRALAERLTLSGSLVDRIENTGTQWTDIVVARVETLERHPHADTLWLATVDLGERSQTVVTGAQNLRVGVLVPFIAVGATLPGQDRPLEPKMLRGIRSEGMVCSGRELGLNDDHDGILLLDTILAGAAAPEHLVGRSLADVLGETVLDLEITPNRPDCLSIYGLAREVAAITGAALQPMPIPEEAVSQEPASAYVRVDDPDLCSRCTARVIAGVHVGPSPTWLVERLQAAGMRSINNIVDVTNYVMLELGQPLHAYDLDALAGTGLIVRRAREGERIVTLDNVERFLEPDMLVIADQSGPIGIAGVMGSGPTEVHGATTRILLEAATFNGRSIRRTATALGLRSEASTRFEKGLPEALAPLASRRAAALIAELGGGSATGPLIDQGTPQGPARIIDFPLGDVERLLGVQWDPERIRGNLYALGFSAENQEHATLRVMVPWWRADVVESADLVEEVARVSGYDAIPETLLAGTAPHRPTSHHQRWYAPTRRILLACGLSEASSPALIAGSTLQLLQPEASDVEWLVRVVPNPDAVRAHGAIFEAVRVVNPLSPEREFMRPTLLPTLLEALRDNMRSGEDRAWFFELDFCIFAHPGALPYERRTLALAMIGTRAARSWAAGPDATDFYDLKGVVEQVLAGLGVSGARLAAARHAPLHPGRSVSVASQGVTLGFAGELHPLLAARLDLGDRRAYVAEFDFEALALQADDTRTFEDYSRMPAAKRDLAVIVDDALPAEELVKAIYDAGKELVTSVTLFDRYRGPQLPAGKKSLAFSLELQAVDRTLTEEQIDKITGRVQRSLLHRFGAVLRS